MELEIKQQLEGFQANMLEAVREAKSEWKSHFDKLVADGANVTEVRTMVDRAIKRLDGIEAEMSRPNLGDFGERKTIGDFIVENEATANLAKKMGSGGVGYTRGTSATIPVKSFMQFPGFAPDWERKTVITSSAIGSSTPGILEPQRMAGIVKPGVRRLRVRDLMPRSTTQNNAIEFLKENVFTNAASPTAETISKPESALTFMIDSVTVKTIAHWIPLAKQVLDDFAALSGYVNQRLMEGLKDIEDWEIVAGDGTGQHLSGLSAEATAYDTALNVSADTRIDKLNHAIGQIENVLQYADGIIMHPYDWRSLQLIKEDTSAANTGPYLLGGPVGNAAPMIWGLPVATTTAVARNSFYVGNFGQYTMVWDRMDARIDISSEHSDYFIRNMIAVRCEERIAFTVTRADAIVYGTF